MSDFRRRYSTTSELTSKKVLVAMPKGMLMQIDEAAAVEHRTRSDLIREALRRYLENFKRVNTPYLRPAEPIEKPSTSNGRSAADSFADPRSTIRPKHEYEHQQARERFLAESAHRGIPQGFSSDRRNNGSPQ